MRLVLILPEIGGHGGGIRVFYRSLARRWVQAHACYVVTGMGSVAVAEEHPQHLADGSMQVPLGIARLERWRVRFSRYALFPELQSNLAASWALRELALELSPDVVEVCDIGLQFAAWIAAPATPYVVQLHGSNGQISRHDPFHGRELEGELTRLIEASLLHFAPAVQASTNLNQSAWGRVAGVTAQQILPAWEPQATGPASRSAPTATERSVAPVFRVFGRLQRWKGAETMALALCALGESAPMVEWYGVDMPFDRPGQSTGDYLGHVFPAVFGQSLRWFAQVDQHQVTALQATALCNVIPSTWDVLNFTVIEAMASGRPIICSRGAGASELIEEGVSGLLFDAEDAAGLADAMRRMLTMPEPERLRMAAAAREIVRERLDPDRNAAQRLEAYRAVIDAWHEPRPPLPEWLAEAVSPESAPPVTPWPVLDNLPLKGLLSYTGKRLARKLMGKRAS